MKATGSRANACSLEQEERLVEQDMNIAGVEYEQGGSDSSIGVDSQV